MYIDIHNIWRMCLQASSLSWAGIWTLSLHPKLVCMSSKIAIDWQFNNLSREKTLEVLVLSKSNYICQDWRTLTVLMVTKATFLSVIVQNNVMSVYSGPSQLFLLLFLLAAGIAALLLAAAVLLFIRFARFLFSLKHQFWQECSLNPICFVPSLLP